MNYNIQFNPYYSADYIVVNTWNMSGMFIVL